MTLSPGQKVQPKRSMRISPGGFSAFWSSICRIAVRISHLWPLRPGHHHVDLAGPTRGTYEPRFPIEDRDSGTEALGEVRGIGLDLTPACPAPDDQAHAGGRGGAECHRWTGLGIYGYAFLARKPT